MSAVPSTLTYFTPKVTFPDVAIQQTRGMVTIEGRVPLTIEEHSGKYSTGDLEANLIRARVLCAEEPLSFRRGDNDPNTWKQYHTATSPPAVNRMEAEWAKRNDDCRVNTELGALIGSRGLYRPAAKGVQREAIGVYGTAIPLPHNKPEAWQHLTHTPHPPMYSRMHHEADRAAKIAAALTSPLAPPLDDAVSAPGYPSRVEFARLYLRDATITVVSNSSAKEAELETLQIRPEHNGWIHRVLNSSEAGGAFRMAPSFAMWNIMIDRRKTLYGQEVTWREEQAIPHGPLNRYDDILPSHLTRLLRSMK